MNGRHGVEMRRPVRVERGVYRQPNGKYAVCFMLDGKPRFRTVEGDLDAARSARARLAIASQAGLLPPRLTFATVAARWLERFETMSRSASGGSGPWRATATTSTTTCFPCSDAGGSRRSASTTSPV
jgi:hypothetical protein